MVNIYTTNEDGDLKFKGTQNYKYLVIYELDDDICDPVVSTATEIFNKMDMSDCYPIHVERILMIEGKELTECRFRGTWHDPNEPLKMVIENRETEEIMDVGYGSDH